MKDEEFDDMLKAILIFGCMQIVLIFFLPIQVWMVKI